jgi:hypothetical protein
MFQADAAEGRPRLAMSPPAFGIALLISISKTSMPANFLNRTALPHHGGHASGRCTEPQHRRIGDHDQIAAAAGYEPGRRDDGDGASLRCATPGA